MRPLFLRDAAQGLLLLCMVVISGITFADGHELPVSANQYINDDEERDWTKTQVVVGLGIGAASAEVIPNDNNVYIDENGLSLGVRIAAEKRLLKFASLQGGLDVFNSINGSTFSNAKASWASLLTAGITLGDITQHNQFYISAAYGFGFAILSDQGVDANGDDICIFCSNREGGASAGAASRLTVGFTGSRRYRMELSWLRVGGNGNNSDFPDGEEAFMDSVLFSIVATAD